jgi:hypothetical protein
MAANDSSSPNENHGQKRQPRDDKGRRRRTLQAIRVLRTLPKEVFRTCVRRLIKGDPAIDIARWVSEQPDRGDCSHLSLNSLRVYMQQLRQLQRKLAPNARNEFETWVRDTASDIHDEQVHRGNQAAIKAAIETAGETEPTKASEAPLPVERRDETIEQALAEIEEEVREFVLKPIGVEQFILHPLLVNRKRQERAWRLEWKVGIPMRELTEMSKVEVQLLGLLLEARSDCETPQKTFPRGGNPGKNLTRWAGIEVNASDPSAEQKQASEIASRLTPGTYDATLRASQILVELADLDQQEALSADEDSKEPPDDGENT